ncbi:pro-sigmaK processing inhibitor BofA family protein [Ructibacterium gallinarum]|uniref:Pro-sigmaK processing inhibitor BofA family protein n=1 Tax=Ructibacterium gallinarum TaxID=2779355 RepID=A0A9D5R946_9FIRM|nr:pro-sigmaK processing inhibitor BofA family protein [Ructibacterium gallinarum]MBE5040647.1 pro-sigmaK processing inhibitor BofA family protein [Ructibacterium gallinarum]
MVFDMGSVFMYLLGLFLLYLCCRLFIKPIKWLLLLFLHCLLGIGGILLFNLVVGSAGWHVAVNPLTAITSGVLGIPGIVMMLFMQSFL